MGTPIWRPDLATGIVEVDRQHEELLANVAMLRSAARTGQAGVAEAVLTFLERYAAEHFAAEERAMWQAGYPDLDAHWSLHLAFATELARRKAEYRASASPEDLLVELGAWMDRWLEDHLMGADAVMARFLRGNADRTAVPFPQAFLGGTARP
jgi:hemerythrin-like metal-binding protein